MEVQDFFDCDLQDSQYSFSSRQQHYFTSSVLKGIPFAYLLNEAEFYFQKFYINQDVLIPRPETEFLVDLVVREFKGRSQKVLDIGTGSGAILLSLLQNGVGEAGVGSDISEKALAVARINCFRQSLENKVTFLQCDRLSRVEGVFDLIISNPPYIKKTSQRELVHQSVDHFEPHEALYLADDIYHTWFKDLFKEVKNHLKGTFFMEGHEQEVEDQAYLLTQMGFKNVEVLNDLSGRKRFLRAQH